MSMVVAARTQRRDKSANGQKQPQATAEQLRLAQIMSGNPKEEDKNYHLVEKVMEVTGTSEDNARTALYDANNDTNRAIELILENGSFEQSAEWETAGRKKGKNTQLKLVDSYDEDTKDSAPGGSRWERSESRGRGRGRASNKRRGKPDEPDKSVDDEGRGAFDNRERGRGGGAPRRGRGRGGSYSNRGRQPGRGPRRFGRFNRERTDNKENGGGESAPLDLDEGFGTYTSKPTEPRSASPNEQWDQDEDDWDSMEVGTWSNADSKKQVEKKNDSFNQPWETESWADDLTETKVFQSQNAQIPPSTTNLHTHLQNHPQNPPGAVPQMGERIDLGALFNKKTAPANESGTNFNQQLSNNGLAQTGLGYNSNESIQHTTPSVIQQLQGQSSSLFSENKQATELEPSSRLFGSYETTNASNNPGTIGHYGTTQSSETPYSQFNGKLESTERNGSSLLGSFAEQFKTVEEPIQSGILGQIPGLNKSAFTPLKPNTTQQNNSSGALGSDYNNFSQTQQREATQAVKASLGLSHVNAQHGEAPGSGSPTTGSRLTPPLSQETLSFGAPLTMRQPKPQRRKQPSTYSKIPAAAVEMPGSSGNSYHEMSNFDLQFGIDDNAIPAQEFGSTPPSKPSAGVTQSSLFSNSAVTTQGLMTHLPPGSMAEPSMFTGQIPSQQTEARSIQRSSYQSLQSDFSQSGGQLGGTSDSLSHQQANEPTSLHASQRFPDAPKSSEPLRGPPGLPHPSSLSSSGSSATGLGSSMSGAPQQAQDLKASYGSARIGPSGNISLAGLSAETAIDPSSLGTKGHSFYATTSHTQTQQQLSSDLSNSAGRSLRSPVPTSSLQGSMQGSPMPAHMSVTPSKDDHSSGSVTSAISSLTSGLGQTHITPHSSGSQSQVQAAPLNIPGTNAGTAGSGNYGSMNMHLQYSASPQASSQSAVAPTISSPVNKHLASADLYSSAGLHHNHQQPSSTVSSMIASSLGAGSPMSSTAAKTSVNMTSTKPGPPNLPLGVPPLMPSQYTIPMAPGGLMAAYAPEALYGYPESLMAVQSRVVNPMQNYYDISSFHNSNNQAVTANSANRESSASTTNQGHREPSSPTSVIGMVGASSQQVAGQHNAQQLKVSQTGSHQQPFMNLPTGPAAYPGYANVYYNAAAFQYPPVLAAVPQSGKHSANATTAFQQHGTGFANAYSTASINATSANNLHDLQGQGYNKNHVSAFDKQQAAAFHHHTNTPPPQFNYQTLTAAMAAANSGGAGAGGGAPGMSPYTQSPFMAMLPTHHLHVQQHGDVGQNVGSQRAQNSNPIGKSAAKPGFGQYWGN